MPDRISTARLLLWLAFAPAALVNASVAQAIRSQPSALDPKREAELRASFTKQFGEAVASIRIVLRRSFLVVFGALAAAVITGQVLAWLSVPSSAWVESALQYGGIAVLLWATIGRAGWSIQTMDGETLPERVDLAVYNWLYVLGSYALALPVAW